MRPQWVRPTPSRLATHPAVSAPINPVTPPILKITPIWAGPNFSSRVANRMKRANNAEPKKLDVPVHPAIERSNGLPKTTLRPSRTSTSTGPRTDCSVELSRRRIKLINPPDATNDIASSTMASGAETS